jgi:tRNA(Ile)-lysidine synthase
MSEGLLQHLDQALASSPPDPLCVAFSGGGDSLALLHALAQLPAARERGLRALHVDHGLHQDSARWAARCEALATGLGLSLVVRTVKVDRDGGQGLEAAARRARYLALAEAMQHGERLLTAHHQDDQAETLLLRLLHGAGGEGLAGMRALRRFGPGWLWRPLLDTPRAMLRSYAQTHRLDWIEDPANADPRHARSWLRTTVMPQLAARWPGAGERIARAAARLREEDEVLDRLARESLAAARTLEPCALRIEALLPQAPALRRRCLGLWLDELALPRPPAPVWDALGPELLRVRPDAEPRLAWRGAELRRYRDLLWGLPERSEPAQGWQLDWNGLVPAPLPPGFGSLRLEPSPPEPLQLTIAPRRGGERIRLHGTQRSDLRKRLQEVGLPPWQRERLPLLFSPDGELLAAGDLLIAQTFRERLAAMGCSLRWQTD